VRYFWFNFDKYLEYEEVGLMVTHMRYFKKYLFNLSAGARKVIPHFRTKTDTGKLE